MLCFSRFLNLLLACVTQQCLSQAESNQPECVDLGENTAEVACLFIIHSPSEAQGNKISVDSTD